MDFDFGPDYIFPAHPIKEPPIPREILAEPSEDTYLVAWHPSEAGIVHRDPEPVEKDILAAEFPHIVKAWETKRQLEKREAARIEENFVVFAARSLYPDPEDDSSADETADGDVDCDQSLRPGMARHWGESRKCETHPAYRPSTLVCKGCRVAHYAQDSSMFDRPLIMARGARVPVCVECADSAVEQYWKREEGGAEYKECMCNRLWTCCRCREGDLERLAKAREGHVEGACGRCGNESGVKRHVDICLSCQGWRVYAVTTEEKEMMLGTEEAT